MQQDGTVILWYSTPSINIEKANESREDYVFQKNETAMQILYHTFGETVHKHKSKTTSVRRNTSLIKYNVS